ncbi:MAG: glycerophosphodiester phosphodiesterase family protein [Sphingopyxis sp.]|nr:glycerophosphodiester phosphodiesterase family protein [Sphingopyxis sp.]
MRIGALVAALLIGGCAASPHSVQPSAPSPANRDLAEWFDCLRHRGEAVIGAHRAGPAPGLPENALETMAATLARNPDALLEIDVQVSADGVLFLLHDDMLDRTTSGSGRASELRWEQLARLNLRDNAGTRVDARIPSLADALALAIAQGGVVQLDVKRGVDFAAVVAAVRKAGAERNAIIITYRDQDALTVARLAPELMVSAGVNSLQAADALIAAGMPRERLLAWTGTRAADTALFAQLRSAGIEPLFGTLGRPGERLDDRWLADGDASEFAALERDGAVVVATDRAREVEAALGAPTCRR